MDHFLPVSRGELISELSEAFPAELKADFLALARLYNAILHFRFHETAERIKQAYLPFAPDSDVSLLHPANDTKLDNAVSDLAKLLVNANYHALNDNDLNSILSLSSPDGIEVQVDLSAFQRLQLYTRGHEKQTRQVPRWYAPWKKDSVEVDIIPRLYMLLQLAPPSPHNKPKLFGRPPAANIDQHVHLKLFKDIPVADLEMLFPNCQIKLSRFDKLKLGVTSGGGTAGGLIATVSKVAAAANPLTMVGAIAAFAGLLARQIGKLFNQRTRYMMRLAQHLYFHSLANNLGVVTRLVDMAEEEEGKESLLAYGLLLQHGPQTADALDQIAEQWLLKKFSVSADFDIKDALDKLLADNLVTQNGRQYSANNISLVSINLDEYWDNIFNF